VLPQIKHAKELLEKNAELAAKLKLSADQLGKQQQEIERLKGLEGQNRHLAERVVLLEEEVRWFKERFFGRSRVSIFLCDRAILPEGGMSWRSRTRL
jgi:hypothetical protein